MGKQQLLKATMLGDGKVQEKSGKVWNSRNVRFGKDKSSEKPQMVKICLEGSSQLGKCMRHLSSEKGSEVQLCAALPSRS